MSIYTHMYICEKPFSKIQSLNLALRALFVLEWCIQTTISSNINCVSNHHVAWHVIDQKRSCQPGNTIRFTKYKENSNICQQSSYSDPGDYRLNLLTKLFSFLLSWNYLSVINIHTHTPNTSIEQMCCNHPSTDQWLKWHNHVILSFRNISFR